MAKMENKTKLHPIATYEQLFKIYEFGGNTFFARNSLPTDQKKWL